MPYRPILFHQYYWALALFRLGGIGICAYALFVLLNIAESDDKTFGVSLASVFIGVVTDIFCLGTLLDPTRGADYYQGFLGLGDTVAFILGIGGFLEIILSTWGFGDWPTDQPYPSWYYHLNDASLAQIIFFSTRACFSFWGCIYCCINCHQNRQVVEPRVPVAVVPPWSLAPEAARPNATELDARPSGT